MKISDYTYERRVTSKEVGYPTDVVIPKGFTFTRFGPAKKGEYILLVDGGTYLCTKDFGYSSAVICLTRNKTYTFRDTGEFRNPNEEWTRYESGSFYRVSQNYPCHIYELTESED